MKRVLEPELMNNPEQAAVFAGAAMDYSSRIFVQLFRKYFPNLVADRAILDLGCGPAAIPLLFAKLFPKCQVHCVDGAPQMLKQARQATQLQGLAERVLFFHGRLPDKLTLPQKRYDIVISNSFLHHLTEPMILWNALQQYCLPKAAILIVDLLRPTSQEHAWRVVDAYLPDGPPLLRKDMLYSLGAAFTLDEVRRQLEQANLRGKLRVIMVTPVQFAVYGHFT